MSNAARDARRQDADRELDMRIALGFADDHAERRRSLARAARDHAATSAPIIAWDGEGLAVPDGQPQPYVLLANSAGGRWRTRDRAGLSTALCLGALLSTAVQYPKARHFIFGGSYDVNQWLRDLPEHELRELWRAGKVYHRPYLIAYRPRKYFQLKDFRDGRRVTIWDAYSWYQTSFVNALRAWLPDYPGLDEIVAMKSRRAEFGVAELDAIEHYTGLELDSLVMLVRELIRRLVAADIHVSRFDGPGAAAAALLRSHHMKQHRAVSPLPVQRAAAVAYSGGRIELMQYGTHDATVYHYDIHSAYPAAMTALPPLAGGTWRRVTASTLGAHADVRDAGLYHVQWRRAPVAARKGRPALSGGTPPFYPFPFRDRDGSIYYPPDGETWVWGPEYAAYLDHASQFDLDVTLLGAYLFDPQTPDARPFRWVHELYDERRRRVAAGDASEHALKLGINSLYGKLAQTVGWSQEHTPPFYQLEWAGLITSKTRATLLRAAMQNPASVIMFATDGIMTTRPLDLDTGPELGQWEATTHEGICAIQSGVYLLRDRSRWRAYSRGYDPRDLASSPEHAADALHDLCDAGWRAGFDTVAVPQTRFVTLASALQGRRMSRKWRAWVNEPRSLSLWPEGKRAPAYTRRAPRPWAELVPTQPTPVGAALAGERSMPYAKSWRAGLDVMVNGVRVDAYEDEIEESAV